MKDRFGYDVDRPAYGRVQGRRRLVWPRRHAPAKRQLDALAIGGALQALTSAQITKLARAADLATMRRAKQLLEAGEW